MTAEIITAALVLTGSAFMFFAALGILRFPDLLTRMHAASKASTFGLGCILVAVAISFPSTAIIAKCALVFLFIFLTVPIAAHMIGRAAYLQRVPLWKGTVIDELEGRYGEDRRTLDSRAPSSRS